MGLKESIRKILQQEDELSEIVQLVGKDSLSEDQKAVLRVRRHLLVSIADLLIYLDGSNHQG